MAIPASMFPSPEDQNVLHITGLSATDVANFFIDTIENKNEIVACDLQYSKENDLYEIVFYRISKTESGQLQRSYHLDGLTFGDASDSTKELISCIRKMGFTTRTISDSKIKCPKSKYTGLYFTKQDLPY